jgi:hypothetical protein
MTRLRPFLGRPVAKVLTGMRRVGKSCLLRQARRELIRQGVREKNICFVDKESLEFDAVRTDRDLHAVATSTWTRGGGRRALLVDEVQQIAGWERAIASLCAQPDTDIVLTGSNAHMFSSELATRLSGRYIEFQVQGLSFAEFLQFRGRQAGSREAEFQRYMRYGGLPGLHHMEWSDEVAFQYLSAIYSTILLKDVVARHEVRDVPLLENIARFLFDNVGRVVSANRIAAHLKSQRLRVGVDTVVNYLGYFGEALVTRRVGRFDVRGKRLLELHEKYYLGDIGLRHALLGYREADLSGVLENVVYLELCRRGYAVAIGKVGSQEVDFIATRENEKRYIQVAYLLATSETVRREFGALEAIRDNYPKLVVSLDTVFGKDVSGIRWMNLIDFLLAPDPN